MSHYMTALAMKQRGLKPAAKIVLYWLADHYNEGSGACFPSLKTLADECEMDKSTVVRHLAALEESGLIDRSARMRDNGSQTSTSYSLRLTPVAENNSPCRKIQQGPVVKCDTNNLVSNNPVNEPDIKPEAKASVKNHARSQVVNEASDIADCLTRWASSEAVNSFMAYRKKSKSKGLTLTAAKRLASSLQEIFNEGGNTDDALGLAEERGWQTVKPEWYFNDKQRSDGGSGRSGSGMAAAFAAVAARSTPRQG